jgi:hypothetical protein
VGAFKYYCLCTSLTPKQVIIDTFISSAEGKLTLKLKPNAGFLMLAHFALFSQVAEAEVSFATFPKIELRQFLMS